MKKIYFYLLLFSLTSVFLNSYVYAEETTAACSNKEVNEIRVEAANVKATYDYNYDEVGNVVSFTISIFNITDRMLIDITPPIEGDSLSTVRTYHSTTDGTYSFVDTNLTTATRYKIVVYAYTDACFKKIRTISIDKPLRNKYHDYADCKYVDMQDFMYCQEWITKDFNMKEHQIKTILASKRLDNKNKFTTESESGNITTEDGRLALFKMIKRGIIIGLLIGIVIDLVVIVLLIRKVRENII